MNELKESQYNIWHENNSTHYLYNSFSGAVAIIDEPEIIKEFLSNPEKSNDFEFSDPLKRGGYVVDSHVDEFEILRTKCNVARYNNKSLTLAIINTDDCNMDCPYCFETFKQQRTMNEIVENKLMEFISNKVDLSPLQVMQVTWMGGEPLLNIETIKRLSGKLISFTKEHNINYSAGIITNGYLLDIKTARILKEECLVGEAQITFDGYRKNHDFKRKLKTGEGSYNQILANITEVSSIINRVVIRINIDKTNMNDSLKIAEDLERYGLKNKVTPYLAPIEPMNGCITNKNCVSMTEFWKHNEHLNKELLNRGWKIKDETFFKPKNGNYCAADCFQTAVIDTDGTIHKCWNDVGDLDKSMGSIFDKHSDFVSIFSRNFYLANEPFDNKRCKSCKLLPLCLGNCPDRRIRLEGSKLCHKPMKTVLNRIVHRHEIVRKIGLNSR